MPVIDKSKVPALTGSTYPAPHNDGFDRRTTFKLGAAAGLTQFGANLVVLAPGAIASQRHWHEEQDEFAMITQGVCTLIDDHGAHEMYPGDTAAFPAGEANGHHFVNQSDEDAAFLVVGTHTKTETAWYSDIDMMVRKSGATSTFTRKDGSPVSGETS